MNDRKSSLLLALLPTVAMAFFLVGGGAGWFLAGGRGGRDDLGKVREAIDRIQERYYGQVPREKLIDGAMEGITAKLDPYCEYFTTAEWKEFEEQIVRGKFGGVGIVVGLDRATGYLTVETPVEDSPAFEADILPGDQVREVDGKSVKGQQLSEVVRKIKGEPGTKVTLTIARKGKEPFPVTLTRKIITVRAVKSSMVEDGIGYVRISDFTEMMESFDAEMKKIQEKGMKALVVDLRFNGGGLLSECVKLADRFLDEGLIVTTSGNTGDDKRKFSAKKGDTLPPVPLVVLINEGTASASEIFAGAMKDSQRGKLVGAHSFGKGSVQTPFPLGDGSYLKLTTARYFTPNGTSVHKEEGKKEYGLEPDYRVEMSQEEYAGLMRKWSAERVVKGEAPKDAEKFVDHQLNAALEVLRAALEKREPKVEARVLKKEQKPSEN
ncbi:MAG TPA: S41 family peptidase [Planctomycetota bacterium]|nr:S41 family peptidase [Planctomycetota bacterium]